MKIRILGKAAIFAAAFLLLGPAAYADTEYVCFDASPTVSSVSTATADSSITDTGDSATITAETDCGPYAGNDSEENVDGLFGYAGWDLLDKTDDTEGSNDGIITCTGCNGSLSGSFSFTDVGRELYLIVLKFDGVFSAFLSDSAAADWLWDTDYDGDEKYASSHLSVYGFGDRDDEEVPEPGTLGLLGLGLLGIGIARRRNRI